MYPGLLITAYSLPGLLVDLGLIPEGSGYGTFLFGAGLLAVAAGRWQTRGTWGWQLILGAAFAVVGGADIADRLLPGIPSLGDILFPVLLVLVGVLIIGRSFRR